MERTVERWKFLESVRISCKKASSVHQVREMELGHSKVSGSFKTTEFSPLDEDQALWYLLHSIQFVDNNCLPLLILCCILLQLLITSLHRSPHRFRASPTTFVLQSKKN